MHMESLRKWAIFCLAAFVFLTLGGLAASGTLSERPNETGLEAQQPTQAPSLDAAAGDRIQAGCQITQTMLFSRCGHSVTRRIEAPQETIGRDFTETQAYYELWEIAAFQPAMVEMRREIPLFCPMHTVLSVNDAGEIVYSQNLYGDGMAVIQESGRALPEFSEALQTSLIQGMGFDSQEEAEEWLSAH